jgi:hypothetical protein
MTVLARNGNNLAVNQLRSVEGSSCEKSETNG